MTITGEQKPVDGTPFDFRIKTKIGDRIDQAGGYDLNYCLQDSFSKNLKPAALLTASGRTMKIETNAPGIQVYTGNGINPEAKVWQGKNGALVSIFIVRPLAVSNAAGFKFFENE